MSLKIRLTRMGAKKKPFYRIVAVNTESRCDGRALDYLGYYNPMTQPVDVKIDQEKVQLWMDRGAKPSDTVRSLLKRSGFGK
jgi:small subunit ribosomal protein S16